MTPSKFSNTKTVEQIKAIIASLHEFNPMMGHRGCRLAVTYPEIAKMQTKRQAKPSLLVELFEAMFQPSWQRSLETMKNMVLW